MTEKKYTLEKMFEVWNDRSGECIQIGPDRDGLDLLEIRQRDSENNITGRITFNREQGNLILAALTDLCAMR